MRSLIRRIVHQVLLKADAQMTRQGTGGPGVFCAGGQSEFPTAAGGQTLLWDNEAGVVNAMLGLGKERGGAHVVTPSGTPKRHCEALHRYRAEKSLRDNDLEKWWSWRQPKQNTNTLFSNNK